jgi:hypothetical protein
MTVYFTSSNEVTMDNVETGGSVGTLRKPRMTHKSQYGHYGKGGKYGNPSNTLNK